MRLLFGCGSGRSGTLSLSRLLQAQGAAISHEMAHYSPGGYPELAETLPWDGVDGPVLWEALRRIETRDELAQGRHADVGGDVAYFWLEYAPHLFGAHPDCRVICLERQREPCIESLLAIQELRGHNSFSLTPSAEETPRRIASVPKFEGDREEATGRYWDWCHAQARLLERAYPALFRIFQMEQVLNERTPQEKMLRWAGFEEPAVRMGMKRNTRHDIEERRARKAAAP